MVTTEPLTSGKESQPLPSSSKIRKFDAGKSAASDEKSTVAISMSSPIIDEITRLLLDRVEE